MSLLMDALKRVEQSKRGADVVDIAEHAASEQGGQQRSALRAAEAEAEEITLDIETATEPDQPVEERVTKEEPLTLELDAVATDIEPKCHLQQTAEAAAQSESDIAQKPQTSQPRLEPPTYRPVVKTHRSHLYLTLSLLLAVVAALIGSYLYFDAQLNSRSNNLPAAPSTMTPMREPPTRGTEAIAVSPVKTKTITKPAQVAGADKAKTAPAPVKAEPATAQQRSTVASQPERNSAAKAKQPPPAAVEKESIQVSRSQQKSTLQQQLEQAYNAYQSGELRIAKQSYQQILKRAPDNRDVLMGLAAVHQQQGDTQQARRYYQMLLRLNPKDSIAVTGLLSLQSRGAVEKESQIKLLLEQEPNAAHLHYALGSQYVSQSRWAEAQQAFFQAFSNDPQNSDYIFNLAVSLDHLGKHRMALVYYRRALEQSPGRPIGFDTGRLKQRIGQLTAAGEQQ